MKKLIIFFLLFPFAIIYSQQWEIMNIRDSDNTKYSYKSKSSNTAWVKEARDNIKYYKNGKLTVTKGYSIVLYKFDCTGKKIGVMQVAVYGESNNLVNNPSLEDYPQMDYVIPDSIAEGLLEYFCTNRN